MSKTSQANKKAKAEGKALKGKKALSAASKKAKKEDLAEEPKTAKLSVPNMDKCCHCKAYAKWPEGGHYCKFTGKPTPRKHTCGKQEYAD